GITEGVEDAIAILLSGWSPVWAATSAGGVAKFPILFGIEALTVFADADAAGLRAAQICRDRWLAAGHEAVIAAPGAQWWHDRGPGSSRRGGTIDAPKCRKARGDRP